MKMMSETEKERIALEFAKANLWPATMLGTDAIKRLSIDGINRVEVHVSMFTDEVHNFLLKTESGKTIDVAKGTLDKISLTHKCCLAALEAIAWHQVLQACKDENVYICIDFRHLHNRQLLLKKGTTVESLLVEKDLQDTV